MNEQELREFKANRKPSPQLKRFDATKLHCYGCAHSASSADYPGHPSGERPCCSCIRNAEVTAGTIESGHVDDAKALKTDDEGNARVWNPFTGSAYNGAPYVYFPMDNYVTLDQRDQERFYDEHPGYAKAITFDGDQPKVVES